MADTHIVRFENVNKSFGHKVVFVGLDLAIRTGETLTVIGGSGTGKSVLLKMLIGLLDADSGRILFDGAPLADEKDFARTRRRVGMLFQGGALFDSLTVGENIAYPLLERGQVARGELASIVAGKLSMVGLEGIEDLKPSQLSGGMQKRVALARAIATEPEVILYDEPTTGLDPANASRINHLIRHLQGLLGVTSIVVTHDMQAAFYVSDRIALLADHCIAAVDTVESIRASKDPRVAAFIEGTYGTDG